MTDDSRQRDSASSKVAQPNDELVYEYAQLQFFEYASSSPRSEAQGVISPSASHLSPALLQEQVLTMPQPEPSLLQSHNPALPPQMPSALSEARQPEVSQLLAPNSSIVTPSLVPESGWPKPLRPLLSRPRKMLYLILVILCILVIALGSFLSFSLRSSSYSTPRAATISISLAHAFSQASCPFKPGAGIVEGKDLKCGYLTVPEDPQHPGKRSVKLAVAIFKAPTSNPPPDPFVYLSGGPGGSLLSDLGPLISNSNPQGFSLESVTLGHDFILMDQRGTGYSQPSLTCPEVNSFNKATKDKNLSRDTISKEYVQTLRQCHDHLIASGVNLNAYTTINDAYDVHELIHALGYKQVNLYGVSYGTRLALTVMRLFPGDLRSVILDSTVPEQGNLFTSFPAATQHAYDTLFQTCAADSLCQEDYPDLQNEFYDLVDKLNAHPVTFQDAQYGTVLLTGDDLANWVFSAMYITSFIPYLPLAIDDIYNNDYSIISRVYGLLMLSSDISEGMYYSVECGEDMAFTAEQQLVQSTNVLRPQIKPSLLSSLQSDFSVCQFWGEQSVPAIQKQPVTSLLPTLILSGDLDPITPTSNARIAQRTLSNSYLFVFPGTGHGVFLTNPCPAKIMTEFMQNPHQKPDGSCITAMQEPDFY